ncbi:FAS1-like dehydratase domain-containing protein [Haloterrigena alkaliphila]|uniref:MaoC family dehydratase N-terminal domain-containing protein n=1 Tax=Haloterrigena alkaliphila TaxID=2816475 RepID=A0A8A2VI82_9EURY|nr:MaoC family dehydratase N-terminal domain-containing protein [Haloterrigena alkaliphila]QSX01232.1 MaoC family dehydratase N-terminal domain-containing protein [Haloterrigena alkaliphila]
MDELEAMVGDSRATVEDFRIERGKVEEFARSITEPDPVFRDESVARERGFDAIPAPPTYPRVTRFPRYRPDDLEGYGFDLGFQPEYVLHGEQSYEYERPLRVGDVLTGETTLTKVFQREGGRAGTMTFAVYETQYRDQNGNLVITDRATAIETSGAVDNDADDGNASDDSSDAATDDSETAAANGGQVPAAESVDTVRSIADLEVGDAGPTVVVEDLERMHFVKYAGASGDFNPIHYDEPYARAAGNESVFGQGMFTAGVASRVVTDWFPLEAVDSFGVRFQSQVFPDDTIVATGEVVDRQADGGAVGVDLEATNQHGETLLTGSVTATLDDD